MTPLDSEPSAITQEEQKEVIEKVEAPAKEEVKAEKKPKKSDPDAVTDFSGAFDLASILVNNFKFILRRLHIRLEGNPSSPIPLFSLGIALDSIVFDTMEAKESCSSSDIRKNFDMNGLVVYWCLNTSALLAQAPEDLCLSGMRSFFRDMQPLVDTPKSPIVYNPDDRLLDDLHLHVTIQGDLRKIEDRKRSSEECMKQMCETMKVNEADPVDALILDRLHQLKEEDLKKSRNDFALSLRNTLREEDEDYKVVMGLRARELAECYWELMKTPSPMLRVNVELDKIDLEIEKSQYENIACFLDDFLASLPPSQPAPTPVVEKEEEKEKEEEEIKEPGTPHYAFGVVSFAGFAAVYLLTSYNTFVCLMLLLLNIT